MFQKIVNRWQADNGGFFGKVIKSKLNEKVENKIGDEQAGVIAGKF